MILFQLLAVVAAPAHAHSDTINQALPLAGAALGGPLGLALGSGLQNFFAGQRAADKARSLKNEQKAALDAEAAARAAGAAKAAGTGSNFGREDAGAIDGAFGFARTGGNTGMGRSLLTGF